MATVRDPQVFWTVPGTKQFSETLKFHWGEGSTKQLSEIPKFYWRGVSGGSLKIATHNHHPLQR